MRALAVLALAACGASGPTEAERQCRKDRVAVVQQLDLAEKGLARVAVQILPQPAEEIDNDIGRIQSAESKVMVEAYTKRRDLVPPLRDAVAAAAGAWNGVDDPTAATTAMYERLAAFEKVLDPVQTRFEQSKREGAAIIATLEQRRLDPKEDAAMVTRELRTAKTHGQVADLWLRSRALEATSFTPLRRAIEVAQASCAKR